MDDGSLLHLDFSTAKPDFGECAHSKYMDCQTPAAQDRLLYQNTKHLQIENLEDGIVVYSHDLTNFHNHTAAAFQNINLSSTYNFYPRGFSCEIIVQSPLKSAKIMLRIESFYIPSNTDDCVDNYLYVFDSNTAKAKAMPEAGGERGLCGATYPRFPIFTTNPYICIAFHTSGIRPPTTSNQHPGFRLILTAIQETTTQSCSSGSFYCGNRPSLVRSTMDTGSTLFTDRRPYSALLGSSSSKQRGSEVSSGLSAEQTVGAQRQQPGLGYCISLRTVCDGVSNCADGRDETPEHCHRRGLTDAEWIEEDVQAVGGLSGLLSLGIPASIAIAHYCHVYHWDRSRGLLLSSVLSVFAIAVSTIVTFTIGIGAVVCCCHRCCRSSPTRVSRYPRITGNSFSRQFDLAVASGTTYHSRSGLNESGATSRQLSRFINPGEANFPSPLNGTQHGHLSPPYNHPGVASLHCGNTQSGHLRSGNISQGDKPPQELLTRVGPKIPYSDGGERSTGAPSAADMSIGPQHQLHRPIAYSSVAGSDSYSSIHGNITMGCTPYRTPPGPPPALIPGAMGSPIAYRRVQVYSQHSTPICSPDERVLDGSLEREFTDRRVRGTNPTSVSRFLLSRFWQPDIIPALIFFRIKWQSDTDRVLGGSIRFGVNQSFVIKQSKELPRGIHCRSVILSSSLAHLFQFTCSAGLVMVVKNIHKFSRQVRTLILNGTSAYYPYNQPCSTMTHTCNR
ncbi:LOW QUALITY PROTEIN: hypothetical protein T265_15364 [Opisthorchis viverrini]|uniref:CUB domain-containing protein n=1 Tax=Opisthorchis viverrini TaxID=6198 RepID=A0A074YZP9_OPIVI|nr:LOW QUALITY PROTEIN: hypothetical protein T265_15364 [Opisthorchis viverrini]KER20256.1 LOW QUALITY PROTEIN: hypothetical protein T265_15364 [Opisthorchis viverrini]